jgi:putative ABC transport system substrate-binding protein
MRRREFIASMVGAAVTRPLAVIAQQTPIRTIGYLNGTSFDGSVPLVTAFRQALAEVGYAEGRTLAIEYRWADGKYDQLPSPGDWSRHRKRWHGCASSTPRCASPI